MPISRTVSEVRLVNGSTGDPALYIDYPGRDDALLFDAGDNAALDMARLGDLGAVFVTHHHVDHFIGLDRIVRANIDRDKTLRIFGPLGTIRKVYDRVKSYEYPFFPFQKVVLEVHELLGGRRSVARLECARHFPEPAVEESPWDGPVVMEADGLTVEAVPVDHTVPCLAFALVERPGFHPDAARLLEGPLRPGPWVLEVLGLLRDGADGATPVTAGGRSSSLAELRDRYFVESSGSRIAYVTDTAWSEASRPGLLRLAGGARRLYSDSFYAQAQHAQAEKYRHMTATQAAGFALEAGVEELVLIHFSSRYAGHYEALVAEARAVFPATSAEIERGPPGDSTQEPPAARECLAGRSDHEDKDGSPAGIAMSTLEIDENRETSTHAPDDQAVDAPRRTIPAAEALERLRRGETLRHARVERLKFEGEVAHPVRMVDVTLVRPVFSRASFVEEVSLRRCTIDRPRFNAGETLFANGLDVSGATLVDTALRKLRVRGTFTASNLRASGKLLFDGCTFEGRVRFWEARFAGWVDFKGCAFAREADFRSLHAEEGLVFHACSFAEDALFRGASVSKKFDLTDSRFEALLDLSKAKLHDFAYLESIVQGAGQRFAFHNALAERLLVRTEGLAGRLASEERGEHRRAMEEYGLLKRGFEGLHRYDQEDWAFYRFKVNQRRSVERTWRRPWTKLAQFADWLLLDLGCGYGTSPARAVRMAVAIMLAFGLIYVAKADALHVEVWPFDGEASSFANRLLVGLVTTVSVFTTGFGSIRDAAKGWMNVPLLVESLLGTLLWGLFIVAFSRKVIR